MAPRTLYQCQKCSLDFCSLQSKTVRQVQQLSLSELYQKGSKNKGLVLNCNWFGWPINWVHQLSKLNWNFAQLIELIWQNGSVYLFSAILVANVSKKIKMRSTVLKPMTLVVWVKCHNQYTTQPHQNGSNISDFYLSTEGSMFAPTHFSNLMHISAIRMVPYINWVYVWLQSSINWAHLSKKYGT